MCTHTQPTYLPIYHYHEMGVIERAQGNPYHRSIAPDLNN